MHQGKKNLKNPPKFGALINERGFTNIIENFLSCFPQGIINLYCFSKYPVFRMKVSFIEGTT